MPEFINSIATRHLRSAGRALSTLFVNGKDHWLNELRSLNLWQPALRSPMHAGPADPIQTGLGSPKGGWANCKATNQLRKTKPSPVLKQT